MPTISIKLPLFEPAHVKTRLYEDMRSNFSEAANLALQVKQENPKLRASEVDRALSPIVFPSFQKEDLDFFQQAELAPSPG